MKQPGKYTALIIAAGWKRHGKAWVRPLEESESATGEYFILIENVPHIKMQTVWGAINADGLH